MGLFSSSSKKSSTYNTTNQQEDNKVSTAGYGDGVTVGGSSGSFNRTYITDGGAIAGAFDVSKEAMEQMNDSLGKTYGFADDFADKVLEAGYYSQDKASEVLQVADNMATSAFSQVEKMSQSETANEIQTIGRYGALLIGLAVAGMVVVKLKG